MKQNYVKFKQTQITSSNGERIWSITLIGCSDRRMYITYVDPKNRNYSNWSHIIHRPTHGFVLSHVKIRDIEKSIVDADSKPTIAWEADNTDQVFDEMYSVWREQDEQPKNNFREIFE